MGIEALKSGHVAMCFFGDGAAQTGAFHESLNIASLWSLPIVFVCDNNEYGLTVRLRVQSSIANIAERAAAYSMPGETLDGNDVLGIYEAARSAVGRARTGAGPTLIEAKTYRTTGFSTSDVGGYQPEEEIALWKSRDPLLRCERLLIEVAGRERWLALQNRAREELEQAFKRALEAPYPDPSELRESEYSRGDYGTDEICAGFECSAAGGDGPRSTVIVYGEDIATYGGLFRVTEGLLREFGPERVLDTPISEATLTGMAVGASMMGLKPVLEIMYGDFLPLCLDALVNQASPARFIWAGQVSLPFVLRTQGGVGVGAGAQHSKSLEAMVAHIPGIKVVAPVFPVDAKALLIASIRDPDPVVFIEHKLLYNLIGEVPANVEQGIIGRAAIVRSGTDISIIANSRMVLEALKAADRL